MVMRVSFSIRKRIAAPFNLKNTYPAYFNRKQSQEAAYGKGFVSAIPVSTSLEISDYPSSVDWGDEFSVNVYVLSQLGSGMEGKDVALVGAGIDESRTTNENGLAVFDNLSIHSVDLHEITVTADGLTDTFSIDVLVKSYFPPQHNSTYVKATTRSSRSYEPWFSTDPALSLTGHRSGTQWLSNFGHHINQRFHIDVGESVVVTRIYYENSHNSGGATSRGVNNFVMYGSNSQDAFDDLTWGADTGWIELSVSQNHFDRHVNDDVPDPHYIDVHSNGQEFRYYAFAIADTHSSTFFIGLRHIELQAA